MKAVDFSYIYLGNCTNITLIGNNLTGNPTCESQSNGIKTVNSTNITANYNFFYSFKFVALGQDDEVLVGLLAKWIGISMITTPAPAPLEELEEELEAEEAASEAKE
jgi:hypothetical protein